MTPEVCAAGAVVWRTGPSGARQVVLVHRPRYDDWTLPKGKLDDGEDFLQAAVREVAEETGLTVEVGPYLTQIAYADQQGRHKVVRYWAMQARGGTFVPNDEVDGLRWLEPQLARARLTYARDREVLAAFATLDAADR